MRYFFPQELNLFMAVCGLRLLNMRTLSSLESPPNEDIWNALVLAEAYELDHSTSGFFAEGTDCS
jgi:hypothetical protein